MENPTSTIDVSFIKYVNERTYKNSLHLQGGIPDYAFATDYSLRQKLKAIPGLYTFIKAILDYQVPLVKQQHEMNSLKVGPNQFPDIYEMVRDCANKLGIGIPSVYIERNMAEFNAYTIATEDSDPIVVITSSMAERYTSEELKAIIGHECGHIHNNHGIYDYATRLLIQLATGNVTLSQRIAMLASSSISFALKAWSRAGEVSCDRAGIICSGDVMPTITAQAKFMGGVLLNRSEVNVDDIMKQYEKFRSTPVRLVELSSDHPSSIRRIFAAKEFYDSEVYYSWNPEQKEPGKNYLSKQELDARCDKFISVIKSEKSY